jgi:hypothetical protein
MWADRPRSSSGVRSMFTSDGSCSFVLWTVRALGPDRPQSWPEKVALGIVPELLCGQSDLVGRTVRRCQIDLGRDCVVFGICTTDCPEDKPGQYWFPGHRPSGLVGGRSACVNSSWSELWCSKLSGSGRSGQGWRTVRTSLFWQIWQISNGKTSFYVYGGPSGPKVRTVRVCAEYVLFAHNGWIWVVCYK